MRPTRSDDAVVDLLDVILRDGIILEADVVVTVADVPLVGISLRAAVAGMTTMTRYGFFEEWQDDRPVDGEGPSGRAERGLPHRRRDRVERERERWERYREERDRAEAERGPGERESEAPSRRPRDSGDGERSGDEPSDRSGPT